MSIHNMSSTRKIFLRLFLLARAIINMELETLSSLPLKTHRPTHKPFQSDALFKVYL